MCSLELQKLLLINFYVVVRDRTIRKRPETTDS